MLHAVSHDTRPAPRDALLRATITQPHNLQYSAESGSLASTLVDLV